MVKERGEAKTESKDSIKSDSRIIKKLRKNIKLTETRKRNLSTKLKEFENKLLEGRITYSEYEYLRNNYLDGKTEGEWYQYYDEYKDKAARLINEYKPLVEQHPDYETKKSNHILIPIILVLLALPLFFFLTSYTGFFVAEDIQFEYNQSWTEAFVRVSSDGFRIDIPALELLVNNDTIIVNLTNINSTLTGDVYVDLIADGQLIDSRKITIETDEPVLTLPVELINESNQTFDINITNQTIYLTNVSELNLTNGTLPQNITELNLTNATLVENITLDLNITNQTLETNITLNESEIIDEDYCTKDKNKLKGKIKLELNIICEEGLDLDDDSELDCQLKEIRGNANGLRIHGKNSKIINCKFIGFNKGIEINDSSNIILDNILIENTISGVSIGNSSSISIFNLTISNSRGTGFVLIDSPNAYIENITVSNNPRGALIINSRPKHLVIYAYNNTEYGVEYRDGRHVRRMLN